MKSLRSFEAAAAVAPSVPQVHLAHGLALQALGRPRAAVRAFERYIARAAAVSKAWEEAARARPEWPTAKADAERAGYRARLRREIKRAGGWSPDVERRVRAAVKTSGEAAPAE